MLPPGHIVAGYLVTYGLIHLSHNALSSREITELLIIGTALGVLPDIDFIPFFISRKSLRITSKDTHRKYPTHAPLVWLVIGLAIAYTASSPFFWMLGLLIWLAPWSHFLGDSIEFGVRWFWPFSNRYFSIFGYREEYRNDCTNKQKLLHHYLCIVRRYIKESPVFWLEIILIVTAGLTLFINR